MHYIHDVLEIGPEQVVKVRLNRRANVMLLDEENYEHYLNGEHFYYRGGFADDREADLQVPRQGIWHLVVDSAGYPGRLRAEWWIENDNYATQLKSA